MAEFKKPKTGGGGGGGGNNSALELLVFGVLAAVLLTYFRGFLQPILKPAEFLMSVRNYFAPWLSRNLWWLEIVSVILSAFFLWGIIHIIRVTNYLNLKKEQFLERFGKEYVSRRRSLVAWKQIQKRLGSSEQNDWKLAILEADHILNEILKMSGYLGRMDDKLKLLEPAQLKNIEDVRRAHIIHDKIKTTPSFVITQEEAKDVLSVYEQSFTELGLIDSNE